MKIYMYLCIEFSAAPRIVMMLCVLARQPSTTADGLFCTCMGKYFFRTLYHFLRFFLDCI